jgi:hypothetical protein
VFESGAALSINATNNRILIRSFGPNSDDWIGKEIELFAGTVEFQGRPLDAVLVRPISPPLKPAERTKIEPDRFRVHELWQMTGFAYTRVPETGHRS